MLTPQLYALDTDQSLFPGERRGCLAMCESPNPITGRLLFTEDIGLLRSTAIVVRRLPPSASERGSTSSSLVQHEERCTLDAVIIVASKASEGGPSRKLGQKNPASIEAQCWVLVW